MDSTRLIKNTLGLFIKERITFWKQFRIAIRFLILGSWFEVRAFTSIANAACISKRTNHVPKLLSDSEVQRDSFLFVNRPTEDAKNSGKLLN